MLLLGLCMAPGGSKRAALVMHSEIPERVLVRDRVKTKSTRRISDRSDNYSGPEYLGPEFQQLVVENWNSHYQLYSRIVTDYSEYIRI